MNDLPGFIRSLFYSLLLFILFMAPAFSQSAKELQQVRYFEVVKLEKCQVFFPENFDPGMEYMLVIGLHGNGGSSKSFSSLWQVLKKYNIIYAVPQSPYNYDDRPGIPSNRYTWSIVSDKRELWQIADPPVTKYLSGIARGLKNEYNICGTIILGFSQGAGFAYATGIRYNGLIDGLICFGGRLPDTTKYPWFLSQAELENNNTLNVFVAHGIYDMAISPTEGRKSFRTLKKLGYNSRLKLFDGAHEVPDEILDEAIVWMQKNLTKDLDQ